MASLRKKVIDTLRRQFPDVVTEGLETIKSTGRVTGWIASDAFDDPDDRIRQKRLWKLLKKELTADELDHLGPIVTLNLVEAEIDMSRN